ncbi:MAG TPA: FMN-binding negative transcriptional regulator [Bryobacteraceae bacterium]|nr:FMN-binding negative transcriptional regulator [Bryobacteraceae bacterium]
MYNPAHFREERPELLREFIRAHPLATLITRGAGGLEANHVPVLLVGDQILRGHVARANPVWRDADSQALAVFTGPDHYISPSWYPSKQEHGRVVPTWNYSVVHAYGTVEFYTDVERLRAIVDDLTRTHEGQFPEPWSITDAPPDYIDGLLNAIVGFDLRVTRLEGKFKQSQNRPQADRESVRQHLTEG